MKIPEDTPSQELRAVPTVGLARLWARLLWQRYSSGGINLRRSIQAAALEAFMSHVPLPELSRVTDEYGEDLILAEIDSRPTARGGLLRAARVKALEKEKFALAALAALRLWHRRLRPAKRWEEGVATIYPKVVLVASRLPVPRFPRYVRTRRIIEAIVARDDDLQFNESARRRAAEPYV
jgi:hypothetical protein